MTEKASSACRIRSLPLIAWPEADRLAWTAACRPGQRFGTGGRAWHLAPVTRADLARRYGYYLDFLDRALALERDAPPAALVTPDSIAAFVSELQERVRSVTVSGTIYKVRRMAECLAPARNFGWLAEIGKDLAMLARPRCKFQRVVMTERLVEAGLTLMHDADLQVNSAPFRRAVMARNGLMLALLALCPIRLRNYAALEIGRSFVYVDGTWWIELRDTKSGRPDQRPVPTFLTAFVERYLRMYRPILARSAIDGARNAAVPIGPVKALWVGYLGAPLGYAAVQRAVTETTRSTMGVPISPHLFRAAAATSAAFYAPQSPDLASALLQHADPRVTEAHYIRASSLSVAGDFTALIRRLKNG